MNIAEFFKYCKVALSSAKLCKLARSSDKECEGEA